MKKKLLEICNFSGGISGTWTRTFEEAKRLTKKYDVYIFSSDLVNGKPTGKKQEEISGIKIKRFPAKLSLGYAVFFDFEAEALKLKPDIIIIQGFRKPYGNKAVKIAKKIGAKCYLVTHAPFVKKSVRGQLLNSIVWFYDKLYSRKLLNSYDKIFAITEWEIPYLLKLGAKKENIKVIPNGIPKEFFKPAKKGKTNKILFFSRIHPVKDIKTLLKALSRISAKYELDITGPGNENYINEIKELAKKLNIKAEFNPAIYDLSKRIKKLDSAEIFVLPSKREGMPVSLAEAMARGKIAIGASNEGAKELIEDNKSGFIFKIGDAERLAEIIEFCLNKKNSEKLAEIRKNARKSVERFRWERVIKELEKGFKINSNKP